MVLDDVLLGDQRVQHLPHVFCQPIVVPEARHDVAHRPPKIGLDQADDAARRGRKALYAQLMIHKQGADARACQQVAQIVIRPPNLVDLLMQLGVDRR